MKGSEMVRLYEQNGWSLDRVRGSHHVMVKPGRRPQPIPVHAGQALPRGLERKLLKDMTR